MRQSSLSAWLSRTHHKRKSDGGPYFELSKQDDTFLTKGHSQASQDNGDIAHHDISTSFYTLSNFQQDLPSQARVSTCSPDLIPAFRRLNSLLLPVQYTESFYQETIEDPVVQQITRVIIWDDASDFQKLIAPKFQKTMGPPQQDRLVAAIRCRIMPTVPGKADEPEQILYISTLGTLAPYRRHALATHLLHSVTRTAVEQFNVTSVVAHVWEANEDALDWYSKRGFKRVQLDERYYTKLAPKTGAYVLKWTLMPSSLLRYKETSNPAEVCL